MCVLWRYNPSYAQYNLHQRCQQAALQSRAPLSISTRYSFCYYSGYQSFLVWSMSAPYYDFQGPIHFENPLSYLEFGNKL